MRTDDIINILLDERIFPYDYSNTVYGYYQEIINHMHIYENSYERKCSKRKIYYILNKWGSTHFLLRVRRNVYKYHVFNPVGRYNPRTGAMDHTDIYYRLH